MRYALLVLAVAACGAQEKTGAAIGDPCGMKEPCDSDGACDYTAVGGPVCIDANADPDGDGLPNRIDHCPNMVGGQYDEDGDGIGDECDHCPIAPPPAVPDPDGDDVDSPCDPDPDTAGDKIVLFDGFSAPTLAPSWLPTTPSAWTQLGGELIVDLSTIPTDELIRNNIAGAPNLAIEASYRVDLMETSAATHIVSVDASDTRPAGVAMLECRVSLADVDGEDRVVLETDATANSVGALLPAFDTQRLYRIAANATGTNAGCTVIGDNMPVGTVPGSVSPSSLGGIALGARAVKARFQWVLVVARNN